MPRIFSELKSGGTIPMLSPHPEKWGDASPPRPPAIDARDVTLAFLCLFCFVLRLQFV